MRFLSELGINPAGDYPWPLYIAPRSLAALAQIILLEQQLARNDPTGAVTVSDGIIHKMWVKFLTTLVEVAKKPAAELQGREFRNVSSTHDHNS